VIIDTNTVSDFSVETLVEMPIILVHPHSVDPPILVNVYKQAMSRSTFSELLKGTQDTNKSEESDVDDEEDSCSPNFSIFHKQVSFPGLHPNELGTTEALTKRVLSETPRRTASQTYKVNIVDPGNLDAVFQEPIPESPLSLRRRLSTKRYIVPKWSYQPPKIGKECNAKTISIFEKSCDVVNQPIVDRGDLGKYTLYFLLLKKYYTVFHSHLESISGRSKYCS
jgi:hypothetical protein